MKLKLSDFSKMNDAEKEKAIKKLVNGPAGSLKDVQLEVMKYESLYEMSTNEMKLALKNKTMTETHEVCKWLLLAELASGLGGVK